MEEYFQCMCGMEVKAWQVVQINIFYLNLKKQNCGPQLQYEKSPVQGKEVKNCISACQVYVMGDLYDVARVTGQKKTPKHLCRDSKVVPVTNPGRYRQSRWECRQGCRMGDGGHSN